MGINTAHATSLMPDYFVVPSLEWITVDSDLIVRGVIKNITESSDILLNHSQQRNSWIVQDITVEIDEILKGKYEDEQITFRYLKRENTPALEHSQNRPKWRMNQGEYIFFLEQGDPEIDYGIFDGQWILRSQRRRPTFTYGFRGTAYFGYIDLKNIAEFANQRKDVFRERLRDQKDQVLRSSEAIISVIRSIISQINDQNRGNLDVKLTEDFISGIVGEYCENITEVTENLKEVPTKSDEWRLAVPKYIPHKGTALQLCASKDYKEREAGASMLRHYPDNESISVLENLFEHDDYKDESYFQSGFVFYPVRLAAYYSLRSFGIDVDKDIAFEYRQYTKKEDQSGTPDGTTYIFYENDHEIAQTTFNSDNSLRSLTGKRNLRGFVEEYASDGHLKNLTYYDYLESPIAGINYEDGVPVRLTCHKQRYTKMEVEMEEVMGESSNEVFQRCYVGEVLEAEARLVHNQIVQLRIFGAYQRDLFEKNFR